MGQNILFQTFHALLPAFAGGAVFAITMKWLHNSMQGGTPVATPTGELYTYSSRTQKFMIVLGLFCLVCAIGPLAMIGLKYNGPDPMVPSAQCYRPDEDWLAGILLFIGFGLGSAACLADPLKYFARLDQNGITVRGLFSGVRSCAWKDITKIKDHPSMQMISLYGKNETGKMQRLWVPYAIAGLPVLVQRLYEHGLFFSYQKELLEEAKTYLAENGMSAAIPYRLYLPFLTVWRLPDEPAQCVAVLFGVTAKEQNLYEHHITTGTPNDCLREVQNKLERKEFNFHPELQENLATDMDEIIDDLPLD